MMKKRQLTMPRIRKEYQTLTTEIKNECKQAKEEQINEKCSEIESMSNANMANMHKRINKTKREPTKRLYKIKRSITDKKKRINTLKIERICQRTNSRCERETYAGKQGRARNIKRWSKIRTAADEQEQISMV